MCVIIHKPAGIQLGTTYQDVMDTCEEAAAMNSDGFGIQAWRDGNLVANWRSTDQKKILEVAYANLTQPDLEVVAHWRLATHGVIHEVNCHPFPINRKLSFFHNGILSEFGSNQKGREKSDTLDFVERVLRPQFGWWRNKPTPHHEELIKKYAVGQRFAITSLTTGKVWRYGQWEEQDGVWYSNDWLLRGYKGNWAGGWRWTDQDEAEYYKYRDDGLVDYVWDSDLKDYVPAKSVRCECYGDICGDEHDLDDGCGRIGEYEVTVTSWKGYKYQSYACEMCAWKGGVEGVAEPKASAKRDYRKESLALVEDILKRAAVNTATGGYVYVDVNGGNDGGSNGTGTAATTDNGTIRAV